MSSFNRNKVTIRTTIGHNKVSVMRDHNQNNKNK